ncbi:ornithine cyclodeaminase family protein [Corynebacterium epidermidicanis]|uniref:Putative ornithine cyclodeaminase, mu-crystallin n=1 Tax=Corynebacterium epidermidicanis TaxID=1050174 RepID=A0A0G3GT07_9CORY|nr:ornithine cyclodeaminase family protein [Corynebacterium epidermidicanis]AKK03670.1 putative ornithine cyclodeaminase, mu-crystallin [Corynebacterium epidermidicanis]
MSPVNPSFIGADEFRRLIAPSDAREALAAALAGPFDPETDPLRSSLTASTGAGELLSMPSTLGGWIGTKLATVAPNNAELGLPRIQGVYVLFDANTMSPQCVIEASALTELRTPAMSAVAVDKLAHPEASSLLVIGSGPQAVAHVHALAAIRPLTHIALRSRDTDSAERAIKSLREEGLPVTAAREGEQPDIIACCTSASDPVIADEEVKDGACVVAMGSHSPVAREVPTSVITRSQVVIESRATTLAEGGDVIIPINEGALADSDLTTIKQLFDGSFIRDFQRPAVFKGTGMSWQDLAVAAFAAKKAGL